MSQQKLIVGGSEFYIGYDYHPEQKGNLETEPIGEYIVIQSVSIYVKDPSDDSRIMLVNITDEAFALREESEWYELMDDLRNDGPDF